MARIESLTQSQVDRMAEFREKWIRIGLSTEPAVRDLAEADIRLSYKLAGIPVPRKIVWCGSPLSQGLTRAIVLDKSDASVGASVGASVRASVGASVGASVRASVGASVRASVGASVRDSVRASVWDSVWDSVRASVWDSVRASVWDSVWDSVRASVWDSVRASVWDSVRASVGASVWDSVRASVGDSVGASVWDSVRASVWDSVGDSGYGSHDANWLAYYEYFREVCGLSEQTGKLVGLTSLAKHAGWLLPHQNICWVSERHHILARDERGRLHCVDGPAVAYPDGWAIYAWHGVRVPESVITERGKMTVEQVLGEQNTEVRRVMRNLYGNARFLKDAGAAVIDACPQHGAKLLSMRLPGDPVDIRVCELTCPSTGEVYYERVPPEIADCAGALGWRFDVSGKQYRPIWQS